MACCENICTNDKCGWWDGSNHFVGTCPKCGWPCINTFDETPERETASVSHADDDGDDVV